ncbi:MAG: methylated-DNA--[protein]-cysteine S-methyltransferase [Acidimicrobiia bacterium]
MGEGWISFGPDGGVTGLSLPGLPAPHSLAARPPTSVVCLAGALSDYFAGRGPCPSGHQHAAAAARTPFEQRVYEVVCSIPAGSSMTYGAVAAAVGRPGAARAVGAAMARNPFAPAIPCHLVVGADGGLRGYRGGIEMKRRLLQAETFRNE